MTSTPAARMSATSCHLRLVVPTLVWASSSTKATLAPLAITASTSNSAKVPLPYATRRGGTTSRSPIWARVSARPWRSTQPTTTRSPNRHEVGPPATWRRSFRRPEQCPGTSSGRRILPSAQPATSTGPSPQARVGRCTSDMTVQPPLLVTRNAVLWDCRDVGEADDELYRNMPTT